MGIAIDITGHIFEDWTVINKSDKTSKQGIVWSCRCSCGSARDITSSSLRGGHTFHCGCKNNKEEKLCTQCSISKHVGYFGDYSVSGKTYKRAACNECRNNYQKNRYDSVPGMKQLSREYGDKWRKTEKGKNQIIQKRKLTKESMRIYAKAYYSKNREHLLAASKKRYENNPEAVNKYRTERKKTDPEFKMSVALRSRFGSAFKRSAKSGSAVADLGCSMLDFRVYIEDKFSIGMNWDNYGKDEGCWSIDHIMPLSAFNLLDRQHQLLACHYGNLQPMWHIENMQKGNRIQNVS